MNKAKLSKIQKMPIVAFCAAMVVGFSGCKEEEALPWEKLRQEQACEMLKMNEAQNIKEPKMDEILKYMCKKGWRAAEKKYANDKTFREIFGESE